MKDSSRQVLKDLKDLKSAIKRADPTVGFVRSPKRDQILFDNIMSEIAKEAAPKSNAWGILPKQWMAAAAAVVVAFSGYLVFLNLKNSETVERTVVADGHAIDIKGNPDELIVAETVENPELFRETVLDYHSEQDFALDAVATQLEGFTDSEIEAALEDILR